MLSEEWYICQVRYANSIVGGPESPTTFVQMYSLFGPTYPGSFDRCALDQSRHMFEPAGDIARPQVFEPRPSNTSKERSVCRTRPTHAHPQKILERMRCEPSNVTT